jgi:hypothetical protein
MYKFSRCYAAVFSHFFLHMAEFQDNSAAFCHNSPGNVMLNFKKIWRIIAEFGP